MSMVDTPVNNLTRQESVKLHPNWVDDDHLLKILADNARQYPNEVAMRARDHGIWQEYTWSSYLDHVLGVAAALQARGIQAEDIMLVIGDNRPALYFRLVGAVAFRAVPSPACPPSPPSQRAGLIERERIRYAVAEDQEQVDKLLHVRESHGIELDLIIYDDPRGLSDGDGLVAFTTLVDEGLKILQDNPALRDERIAGPSVHGIAALLHSSGTTGTPKGIPLKHGHVLHGVRNAAAAGYFQEGEIHMAYLPIAWVGDFIFSIGAGIDLRFVVNIPEQQETAQNDLREIAPTLYFCSPRTWSNMLTRIQVGMEESSPAKRWLYNKFMPFAIELERRRLEGKQPTASERLWRWVGEKLMYGPIKDHLGLGRVQRSYTAGEAIGEDIFLFFRALGLSLRQFYGQTENGSLATAQSTDEVMLHTVGRPFPGMEIKINDDGEILMRGDNVFDGYFELPEDTDEALQDGWLHTGDAGYFEEDGQLVVLGRVSEVVYTRQGERFIPTYIENRIQSSHYIRDVCVLGKDRDYLTAIVAIDFQAVGHWAQENNVTYSSYAELSQRPEVYDLIQGLIMHTNTVLPEAQQIRRFVNMHKELDVDDGDVTRTRKLRRNVIDENYKEIIDALYSDDSEIEFEAQIVYETGEVGVLKRNLMLRTIPKGQG